jgi:hypothetical protein
VPFGTIVRHEPGVPIGTVIGAVIGPIGSVTILCLLVYMYKRRQSSRKSVASPTLYEKPELHGTTATIKRVELPGDDTYPYPARHVESPGNGCTNMSELHTLSSPFVQTEAKTHVHIDGGNESAVDRERTGQDAPPVGRSPS